MASDCADPTRSEWAGDAALYSRILGAALDDRADGLGAQAAPWLAGLIEALEQRPVCNPRRIHPGADLYHCRPADVFILQSLMGFCRFFAGWRPWSTDTG